MIGSYDASYFTAHSAHATAREIAAQGTQWRKITALLHRDQAHVAQCRNALNDHTATIVFSGAGTSAYVGEIVAPMVSAFSPAHCQAIASTDLVSHPAACLPRDAHGLFFAFARSGHSPESLDSIVKLAQIAPKMQALAVTCNAEGALAHDQRVSALLMPPETHDESFVMTSSFSTMVLYTAQYCRQACQQPLNDLAVLAEASDALNRKGYENAAFDDLAQAKRLVFLGSNALFGAAKEAALKILEMTAGTITTLAETALGVRHGPKSWINSETVVTVMASNHPYTQQFDADIIDELVDDGQAAKVVVIASAAFFARYPHLRKHPRIAALPYPPSIDHVSDDGLAVLAVQHAQLLGLRCAIALGISPDNPCPSGAVNRVVQGVTLYPYAV